MAYQSERKNVFQKQLSIELSKANLNAGNGGGSDWQMLKSLQTNNNQSVVDWTAVVGAATERETAAVKCNLSGNLTDMWTELIGDNSTDRKHLQQQQLPLQQKRKSI